MEIAILGAGCFWSPEIKLGKLNGVLKTEVGYCGGNSSETSYKEVCGGKTNHAEVVKVEFDENIISYEEILIYFFDIHDPTTLNQQGYDVGTQYRSEIFYTSETQNKIANEVLNKINSKFNGKIVTNISKSKNYCKAENYHQKYLER